MSNAFEVLGIASDADQQQVRTAYRSRVKVCHPDQFRDEEQQFIAQEELIKLNLAYEEALRLSSQRQVGFHTVSASQAKAFARKLMEQGNNESALGQLGRADYKDDEWFFLQGRILMDLRQYETAHASFREAVRRNPEHLEYRRGALDAAIALKRHQSLTGKVSDLARSLFRQRKKT
jgi:molecular chaperone DnaJ